MSKLNKMIGGVLLVSGTTIGAAMLALPVSTGMAGFFPSSLLFLACWCLMTFTAFLILEVTLWMGPHTNLTSMARKTLGRWGEGLTGLVYLFLLYALTTAYVAGSTSLVLESVRDLTGYSLPREWGALPLLLIFGFFVYKGIESVDSLNRLLMAGLAITYVALIVCVSPYVQPAFLTHTDWPWLMPAIPVVVTSFGFHIIIPSLVNYLDYDVPLLKRTLLIGSSIPLVVYLIWELVVLGIVPIEGKSGLLEGYIIGENGANLLGNILGNGGLAMLSSGFSFFAILTSFLGVSLSLNHFLADGFKIRPTPKGRWLLFVLTFLPPLLLTITDPRAFLSALEYAGAFGVMILLGLLPALMVWSGRYIKQFPSTFQVPGGKLALIAAMLISLAIVLFEVVN
jgi:tyrosine-specific transport protein